MRCLHVLIGCLISMAIASTATAQRSSLYADPLAVQDLSRNDPFMQRQNLMPLAMQSSPATDQSDRNLSLPQGNASNFSTSTPPAPGMQALAVIPNGQPAGPMMAAQPGNITAASWIYTPPPPQRTLQIHDIINIKVEETSQTSLIGSAQSRKNALLDIRFVDWLRFDDFDTIKPAVQSDGDKKIGGQDNEVYRADSTLRTRESLSFNIAAEIADIRPNGLLVLTATKVIRNNDNVFELSFNGVCRPESIGPDNVVLSSDIFNPVIEKNERGQVRDGYERGWFTKWFGRLKPF